MRPSRHFFSRLNVRRWRYILGQAEAMSTVKGKKVKVLYGLETNHRTTERHLPYGITQCYLPPDTGERAPP